MQAVGTVANIFGVITPVKDIGEIIKAIADSVKKVKRNKYNISSLKMILNGHIQTLQKGIERCENEIGTKEHMESLRSLQRTLNLLSIKTTELDRSHSTSSFWGMTPKQWWSASGVSDQLEQLETDLKQCRDLFVIDSINVLRQEVNMIRTAVVGDNDGHRSKYEIKCTMTKWKILLKADLSDPMAVNHAYLQKRIVVLSEVLKSDNGTRFKHLLYKNAKQLEIKPINYMRYLIGNPTRDYEDASYLAARLTRAIQDAQISIVEWFNDFQRLTVLAHDVGLWKESKKMKKFQYQFWILLASEQGTNEDAQLACCLYNMADNHLLKNWEVIRILKKAVGIYRRLGEAFISNLADSLRLLSKCHSLRDNRRKAIAIIQESIDLIHKLATKDPIKYGHQMALSLSAKGELYSLFNDCEKAILCYGEAAKWFKASSGPNNVASNDYYVVQLYSASAYRTSGDSKKAIECAIEATTTRNRLISDRPHRCIDYGYDNLTRWFCEFGRKADAINVLEKSLALYCSVVPFPVVQEEFAKTLFERAEMLHSIGKFADALVRLSQVIDVYNYLLKENTNEDGTKSIYFKDFIRALKLRFSCLISLHRPFEAVKIIEEIIDKLRPSLMNDEIEIWSPHWSIINVVEQEIMLEKLDGTKDVGLLKKSKNIISSVDNAIYSWRRLHGDSHRNIFGLFTLRFGILLKRKDFDALVSTMHDVINLYHRNVKRGGNLRSLPGLIGALLDHADIPEIRNHIVRFMNVFYNNLNSFLQYKYPRHSTILTCLDTLELSVNGLTCEGKHSLALLTLNVLVDIERSLVIGEPQRNEYLARRLGRRSEYFFELGLFTEAVHDAEEAVECSRHVVATDKTWWYSEVLEKCLYEHARSSLAIDNIDGALKSVEEAIYLDKSFEFGYFEDKRSRLNKLRADMLSRSGRALNVEDRADRKYFKEMFVLMT